MDPLQKSPDSEVPNTPVAPVVTSSSVPPKSPISPFALLPIFIISLIAVGVTAYLLGQRTSNTTPSVTPTETPTSVITNTKTSQATDFFLFSSPAPLNSLSIYNLPDSKNPNNAILIGNRLWVSGDGSLKEYSYPDGKLISHTNPKIANCDGRAVQIKEHLYVPCHTDNINDAFGSAPNHDTDLMIGHYTIFKINPQTHKIIKQYSIADGLRNGYNFVLYPDGDYLWVSTFDGIGRINTSNDLISFYQTKELGLDSISRATKSSISTILVDKEYVWALNTASSVSAGGMIMFNKQTEKWTAFGPNEIKDSDKNRFDLEYSRNYALKTIPGGIRIAFRDGSIGSQDKLIEKEYSYKSNTWTKFGTDRVATGEQYTVLAKYLKEAYPSSDNFKTIIDNNLSQLELISDSDKAVRFPLNGRTSLLLSSVFEDHLYILTNTTLDILNTGSFPEIITNFGEELIVATGSDKKGIDTLVKLYITPDEKKAIIFDSGCGGMGCGELQKLYLLDLSTKKIIKTYSVKDKLPTKDNLINISFVGNDSEIIIKDENKDLFKIDLNNLSLIFP